MKKARIYKPAKNAMQSGRSKVDCWVLDYDSSTARRPESLMGWTSSSDTLGQVSLKFTSLDEAKAFADREKLDYMVMEPRIRHIKPRNYGDNFKYVQQEDQAKN